ncbi:DUF485 domain-containing protein [Paraburkholderia sp. RL18-101-BIB-B]|uniref:DUF485 domain-containing protein n=1 Tax=unclassified Paraburkholderia TaxID=2615204 RepID=UPI0038B9819C
MQQILIDAIRKSGDYRALVRAKRRFSFTFAGLMTLTYYGFIVLVAAAPRFLARPIYHGASTSIGIVAGVIVIVTAVSLTGWYALVVTRVLDPSMKRVLQKSGGAHAE